MGLSEHRRFGSRSNYAKSIYELHLYQTCTFRYRFDEKPPVIVAGTASRFSLRGLGAERAGPCRPEPVKPSSNYRQESLPPNPACFAAGADDGEEAYPSPTNAGNGRSRAKKRHPTRNPLKHFRGRDDLAEIRANLRPC